MQLYLRCYRKTKENMKKKQQKKENKEKKKQQLMQSIKIKEKSEGT